MTCKVMSMEELSVEAVDRHGNLKNSPLNFPSFRISLSTKVSTRYKAIKVSTDSEISSSHSDECQDLTYGLLEHDAV
jgi:hypothetical protein